MASLNKVLLIGNVGKDPEVRYFESQQNNGTRRKVANFTLATTERYRDRNDELREKTEWHNIEVWGNKADVVEKYVKKGSQLYIEGKIKTQSWTDQNGVKKYAVNIEADNLQLLGRRSDNPGGNTNMEGAYSGPAVSAMPQQPMNSNVSAPTKEIDIPAAGEIDDLPF